MIRMLGFAPCTFYRKILLVACWKGLDLQRRRSSQIQYHLFSVTRHHPSEERPVKLEFLRQHIVTCSMNCWVLVQVISVVSRTMNLSLVLKTWAYNAVSINCLCTCSSKTSVNHIYDFTFLVMFSYNFLWYNRITNFVKRTNSICWYIPWVGNAAWCQYSSWYVSGMFLPKRALYTSYGIWRCCELYWWYVC